MLAGLLQLHYHRVWSIFTRHSAYLTPGKSTGPPSLICHNSFSENLAD